LCDNDITWVAGISIGAINAALICGNPAPLRVARLRAFWDGVSANLTGSPFLKVPGARQWFNESRQIP